MIVFWVLFYDPARALRVTIDHVSVCFSVHLSNVCICTWIYVIKIKKKSYPMTKTITRRQRYHLWVIYRSRNMLLYNLDTSKLAPEGYLVVSSKFFFLFSDLFLNQGMYPLIFIRLNSCINIARVFWDHRYIYIHCQYPKK